MTSQKTLDRSAEMIKQAYLRQNSGYSPSSCSSEVWVAAAMRMHQVAEENLGIPVDAELFVASQVYRGFRRDPWTELTQAGASRNYRQAIRKIVGLLEKEISREIRWATRKMESGASLDGLMASAKTKLSPLSKFYFAREFGRSDLADRYRDDARDQHLSCPLYETAFRNLLPSMIYPADSPSQPAYTLPTETPRFFQFSLN